MQFLFDSVIETMCAIGAVISSPQTPQTRVNVPSVVLVACLITVVYLCSCGSVPGSVEGSLDGSVEGSLDGSVEGSLDGSVEGSLDGSVEGSLDGSVEGSLDGSVD